MLCVRYGGQMMKNRDKASNITTIIAAIIPALVTFIIFLIQQNHLQEKYDDLKQKYDLITQVGATTEDKEDILEAANNAYLAKDYIKAAYLYRNQLLADDPICLNNLAYIYLELDEDNYIYEAKKCIEKAYNLDKDTYYDQYLTITVRCPESYEEVISVLRKGISNETLSAQRYIYNCYIENGITDKTVDDFLSMSDAEKKEILTAATKTETYSFVSVNVPPKYRNNEFNIYTTLYRYVNIGVKTYPDNYTTQYIYANVKYIDVKHISFDHYNLVNTIHYIDI